MAEKRRPKGRRDHGRGPAGNIALEAAARLWYNKYRLRRRRRGPDNRLKEVFFMPDYKAMYYVLAGRMATAIEALEATTGALVVITEKLKQAQQATEEMFINGDDNDDEEI